MAVQTFTIAGNGDDFRFFITSGFLFWNDGGVPNRITVGNVAGSNLCGGWLRFTNVTVPQSTTIASAILKLNNGGFGNTGSAAQIKIQCEQADSPTMPANAADASSRTLGSALTFAPAPTTGIYSFDITSIVQEIINRGGWSSGNALSVILNDNGSAPNNNIRASQYEIAGAAEAAQLEIDYTAGGPPLAVFAHHYRQQGFR